MALKPGSRVTLKVDDEEVSGTVVAASKNDKTAFAVELDEDLEGAHYCAEVEVVRKKHLHVSSGRGVWISLFDLEQDGSPVSSPDVEKRSARLAREKAEAEARSAPQPSEAPQNKAG